MTQTDPFGIVCFSPQDWDVPLRTNRHRIMLEAAGRGHGVMFVQTGRWLPSALRQHGLGSLMACPTEAIGVSVRQTPSVAPYSWRWRVPLATNVALERTILRGLRSRCSRNAPTIAWLYDPRYIALGRRLHFDAVVYDCVDDYVEQVDARSRPLMAHFDAQAAREADIVFATTASLRDRHIRNNAQTRLVPNVADYDHFASGLFAQVPNALSALRRPIIGFAGNIVASKVDLAGLDRLSDTRPDWSWVLIGPVEKAMEARLAALASKPQIHYLGLVDYGSLPSYVAQFDVGLIPYHANSYTASVFPLKYYEYLAAGIPIVASGLVGLPHDRPDVHVLPTLDVAATAAIAEALKVSSPDDVERRQGYAFTHTWAHRAETVLAGASEVLAAKRT